MRNLLSLLSLAKMSSVPKPSVFLLQTCENKHDLNQEFLRRVHDNLCHRLVHEASIRMRTHFGRAAPERNAWARSLSHRKFRPPQIVDATQSAAKIVWLRHDFFVRWDILLGSSILTMMPSAESLVRSHSARPCRTSPAVRCLLPQSEVCAVFVVQADNQIPIVVVRQNSDGPQN